jgi:cytochrome c556
MKKLIAIVVIALILGFLGLSQIKGQSKEKGQENTQMTQMIQNQEQMTHMMKDMNNEDG